MPLIAFTDIALFDQAINQYCPLTLKAFTFFHSLKYLYGYMTKQIFSQTNKIYLMLL